MIPLSLAACVAEHSQSAVHPAGPAAAEIAWLGWVLTVVLTAVFLITMALAVGAVLRNRPPDQPAELGVGFVVASGIVVPTGILVAILAMSLSTTLAVRNQDGEVTVQIVGHQYWWDVIYPEAGVVDANHIVVPAGVPIRLELRSADVIHSFWIPNLHGKMDLIPDRTTTFWLQADAPGRWRGVCAEFCGDQHAKMAFTLDALAPDDFRAWLTERGDPPPEPADATLRQGRAAFIAHGCTSCHGVRGVSHSALGPDLTHFAGRPTLGAGAVPNTPDQLRAWLRDPQAVKPGNLMPPSQMADPDLEALIAWLGSLR